MSIISLDYDGIKALAIELGRPATTLHVLSHQNDPFYITPGRRADAEWFADLWQQFGFGDGTHLRRIHYRIISQKTPVLMPDGSAYENTRGCSSALGEAARDARYLGLVPIEEFVDRKNDDAHVYLSNSEQAAELSVEEPSLAHPPSLAPTSVWLPDPPGYEFTPNEIDQRFHVELWAEKTTVSDILLPLGPRYGLNVVMGAGHLSLTHCHQFVERVVASGRPARILYVSDFDPSGLVMPVDVARKIEFLIHSRGLDLDVQLRPIVLTEDQCREYRLPRTPLKELVKGKGEFEERFGEGGTELDALEALHPGELRRILVEEIERYHDSDLDDRVEEAADEFREQLRDRHQDILDRHKADAKALRAEQRDLARRCNAELAPIIKRYEKGFQDIAGRFNSLQAAIAQELEEEAPDPDEIEWPEPDEGDEDDDPLFDSTRDYVEQVDRFKGHRGRLIKRKVRSDAGRKRRRK
jgi:hypothetical protein